MGNVCSSRAGFELLNDWLDYHCKRARRELRVFSGDGYDIGEMRADTWPVSRSCSAVPATATCTEPARGAARPATGPRRTGCRAAPHARQPYMRAAAPGVLATAAQRSGRRDDFCRQRHTRGEGAIFGR